MNAEIKKIKKCMARYIGYKPIGDIRTALGFIIVRHGDSKDINFIGYWEDNPNEVLSGFIKQSPLAHNNTMPIYVDDDKLKKFRGTRVFYGRVYAYWPDIPGVANSKDDCLIGLQYIRPAVEGME